MQNVKKESWALNNLRIKYPNDLFSGYLDRLIQNLTHDRSNIFQKT